MEKDFMSSPMGSNNGIRKPHTGSNVPKAKPPKNKVKTTNKRTGVRGK